MRRVVTFFVVALVGAMIYGLSGASGGVAVNGSSVGTTTLLSELSAISHNGNLQCYVTALDPTNYAPGAGGYSMKASGAAAWANLRVEGMAINQYVTTTLHYHPDEAALASARSSLEGEMTQQAALRSLHCPSTSAQALDAMPAEMRSSEIEYQATSLYLVARVKTTIPLTTAAMKIYYSDHRSQYDRLCVSIALVVPGQTGAFAKSVASGESVATLARQYSKDPSAAAGGAYGCFAPTNSSYAAVRADVNGLALDTFDAKPQYVNANGTVFALYVAVTKRTVTPFAQAAPAVLSDLRNLNAASASVIKNTLLARAAINVDPAFGRWGLGSAGPQVFAPALPPSGDVLGQAVLSTVGSPPYK